jgi:arylsulfatase A-like enzyme
MVVRVAFVALIALAVAFPDQSASASPQPSPAKPNIIVIYADDIGYGDLNCYGAVRVKTPHCDRLAAGGLRFTDGHAASATCTPSRFALLTGEYPWRTKGTGILPGDAALIIQPGRATLASMLKSAGYTTAVVGKWHLGLGDRTGQQDWNGAIKPGPREIGFDYSFIIPATGDRVPCVYVENHHVVGLDPADPIAVSYKGKIGNEPTGRENPDLLKQKLNHGHDGTIVNGISRIGHMTGGQAARWNDETMAQDITGRAVRWIEDHKDEPFFLYFSTHDIHVPRVPHPKFVGTTEMGPRGDAIVQFDWSVGEILAALDRLKIADNTLIILSSDNGPVLQDGYEDDADRKVGDHKPAGPWRGRKYSNFEGGTRVPFIVRWPARIKPGVSDALVCQIDLLASFAAMTGHTVPVSAGDSENILPALLGDSPRGREVLVVDARQRSLRQGVWKYIPASKGPPRQSNTGDETGSSPTPMLFNLADDPGETRNLYEDQPDLARSMAQRLEAIQQQPRP